MSVMLMPILHGGAGSNAVQLLPANAINSRTETPCYSGIRLDSDGNTYIQQRNGNWSKVGQWLLFGSASSFNVTRTIDSGTLTTDAGAGPLALSTDRTYSITNSSWGTTKRTVITLVLDAGGGDLAEMEYTLSAELTGSTVIDDDDIFRPNWAPSDY